MTTREKLLVIDRMISKVATARTKATDRGLWLRLDAACKALDRAWLARARDPERGAGK